MGRNFYSTAFLDSMVVRNCYGTCWILGFPSWEGTVRYLVYECVEETMYHMTE